MRIALDFDGVLADCCSLKSRHAKEMFDVNISPECFKKELVVKEIAGDKAELTLKQYRELQEVIYGTREVGLTIEPVPNMQGHLSKLLDEGHYLHVVTSRVGIQLEIAEEWAREKGIEIGFTGVGYGVSKAKATKGFDLYIDDDLDKLEPLVEIVPHRYLFSWGYNEHMDETDIAVRVGSWEDFYHHVRMVNEKVGYII